MEISAFFDKAKNIIVTTPIGLASTENILKSIKCATELSEKHQCDLLLFDIRKCSPGQTITEGYRFMQDLKKSTELSYQHKIAIVYDPVIFPADRAHFIETVVANRANPRFIMFTEMAAAELWLQGL